MEPQKRNKLNIEDLVDKLKQNRLNREEFKELLALVRGGLSEDQMNEFFANAWENASDTNEDINSEDLLGQIQSRLQLAEVHVQSNKTSLLQGKSRKLIFSKVVRYAAVFVLAFVLSLMVQNAFKKAPPHAANITYNEVSVSYGSKSKIVLPDGSIVNLNSGSKIRYPSRFENDRNVYIEGEVFFDVKKDAKHPFYVHTSDITIKVLGTVFNVKSYPEENIIETTLVSGSIQIFDNKEGPHTGNRRTQQIAVLKPDQKAIFVKNDREMSTISTEAKEEEKPNTIEPISSKLVIQSQVKTEVYTAWKDNRLVFNNEKFEHLIPKLERWYNIEITNDYPEINTTRFTGKFDLETIEQALLALRITTPFNYKMDKNKITISK